MNADLAVLSQLQLLRLVSHGLFKAEPNLQEHASGFAPWHIVS
jgi:hypothetical protein